MIDKEYVSPGSSGEHLFSSQSKLDSYRREIQSQTQAEMNIKVRFLRQHSSLTYDKHVFIIITSYYITM